MLYGQPLRFGSCHALDLFLKQIGGRNRVLLQDITVSGWVFSGWEFWWTGGEAMMKLLSEARDLKRLRLKEHGPK